MKQLLLLALACSLATPALAEPSRETVRKIIVADVKDQGGARFQDVRKLRNRDSGEILYCGKVALPGQDGSRSGYQRFLALSDHEVLVEKAGSDPLVLLDNDMISNAWTQLCVDGPMAQSLGPVAF